MKVMVTGANGFVGRSLCNTLAESGVDLIKVVRSAQNFNEVQVGDIHGDTYWMEALEGVDVVVHTAARVHIMRDSAVDPLALYRTVNTEGTLNFASQAAQAGIKRFVFISTIKVNGESTQEGCPFSEDVQTMTVDPYGQSKAEAEEGLRNLAEETGLEVVIIRPPLVYGPGVKGNFRNMLRWIGRGIPLPLGAINNKRSLIALDNLVDLIVTCTVHRAAANQTFLAADDEDLSTTELLRRLAKLLDKPARLVPVPGYILTFVFSLLGKKEIANRLCCSLQVDSSKARDMLGWMQPISVNEGLRRVVEGFNR